MASDFLLGLAQGAVGGFDEQKQQKEKLLAELIKSGQYQPTQNAPPTSFLQRFKQGVLGPQLGGPNASMGGMNFQYQTPEIKQQRMQQQIDQYKNMLGSQPGQQTSSDFSVDDSGSAKFGMKSGPAPISPEEQVQKFMLMQGLLGKAGANPAEMSTNINSKGQMGISQKPMQPVVSIDEMIKEKSEGDKKIADAGLKDTTLNIDSKGKPSLKTREEKQSIKMSDEEIDREARMVLSGRKAPILLPKYGGAASVYMKVMDKVAQMDPNFDENMGNMRFASNKMAMSQLKRQQQLTGAFEKTASYNLDLADRLSAKVDRSGSPLVNKLRQSFQTNAVQDPDLAAFKNSIQTAVNEYAKVITGSTGGAAVSDSARTETKRLLDASDSPEAFKSELNVMRQEMQNRTQGFVDQLDELSGYNSQNPGGQQQSGQSQQFNEGQTATNPATGKKAIFRGGQWQTM